MNVLVQWHQAKCSVGVRVMVWPVDVLDECTCHVFLIKNFFNMKIT